MMILYRRGFGLFDQETLAKFFRVRITKETQNCFNVKLPIRKSKTEEEGINTIESAALVNRFFKAHRIPLQAEAVRASAIPDLASFITHHLQADLDLWLEYKSDEIHGDRAIHDNVVEQIKGTGDKAVATLVDPAGEYKTRLDVPVKRIQQAISTKFDRETGFLVISPKAR